MKFRSLQISKSVLVFGISATCATILGVNGHHNGAAFFAVLTFFSFMWVL